MTVTVAWMHPGQVSGRFAESLVSMMVTGSANRQVGSWISSHTGPVLDLARNTIVRRFLLTTDDEWLLQVDSDMVFGYDLVERLLEHADPERVPIVGALCYSVNHDGVFPVVYRRTGEQYATMTDPPADTLLRVDGTGAACLMVHRTVFEKIAAEPEMPGEWFDRLFLGEKPLGEDLSFCVRVEMAGFPIHVHTGIPIGHEKWVQVIDRDSFVNWRRNHRFVISGTGRSGTKYAASILNAMQIPCGHESIFTAEGPREWGNARGDSSWMAAPFLEGFDGTVIHLVRDPLAVVNSLVGIGFFDETVTGHEPYRGFVREHLPAAFLSDDPVMRAATFVRLWNELIEPLADLRIKVEDLPEPSTAQALARAVGAEPGLVFVDEQIRRVPTDINHRPRAALGWTDMPSRLRDHAEAYGYTTEDHLSTGGIPAAAASREGMGDRPDRADLTERDGQAV